MGRGLVIGEWKMSQLPLSSRCSKGLRDWGPSEIRGDKDGWEGACLRYLQVIYAVSFYMDDTMTIAIILFLNVYYLPGSVHINI